MSKIFLKDALDNTNNLSAAFQNKLLPAGGTTGQFLKKTGAGDFVRAWATITTSDINNLTYGTTDPSDTPDDGDIYMQYEA